MITVCRRKRDTAGLLIRKLNDENVKSAKQLTGCTNCQTAHAHHRQDNRYSHRIVGRCRRKARGQENLRGSPKNFLCVRTELVHIVVAGAGVDCHRLVCIGDTSTRQRGTREHHHISQSRRRGVSKPKTAFCDTQTHTHALPLARGYRTRSNST